MRRDEVMPLKAIAAWQERNIVMAVVKAETNIPIVGTPAYIDVVESKQGYEDQICISAPDWDSGSGPAKGTLYLHLSVKDRLVELGLIELGGKGPDGGKGAGKFSKDSFQVRRKVKITVLKKEQGKQKITHIDLADGPSPASPGQHQSPSSAQPSAMPTARESDGVRFARIGQTMERCVDMAIGIWRKEVPEAQVANVAGPTASCLFIECMKVGLLASAPVVKKASKEQQSKIDDMVFELGWTPHPGKIENIFKFFGIHVIEEMTEKQAADVIWMLNSLLDEKKAVVV
jgi:hypothetical protein